MKQREICLRLYPEYRIVPFVDEAGIRKFEVASSETMGMRVVDDFVEEHIQ